MTSAKRLLGAGEMCAVGSGLALTAGIAMVVWFGIARLLAA